MLFGEKIMLLRKFVGLLQKELGDEIGVSESKISEFENDKRAPSPENLYKIAQACRMHVGYFYDTFKPHEYYQVAKHLKYAYYLSLLPEEVRRYQRKMLKKAYAIRVKDLAMVGKEVLNTPAKPKSRRKITPYHEDYLKELKRQSAIQAKTNS